MKSEIVPHVDSAVLALQRAAHQTGQRIATALVDLDLGSAEVNALANLSDGRARTVSQLGAAVGIRPTTLTSVLDRLERRGHITRGSPEGDRRSVLIELTSSGRAVADVIISTLAELESRALGPLSARMINSFGTVLDALAEPT